MLKIGDFIADFDQNRFQTRLCLGENYLSKWTENDRVLAVVFNKTSDLLIYRVF